MNSSTTSGQTSRSTTSQANTGPGGLESISELSRELATLKDNVARLASQASGEAANTIRSVS